jgi:N-acetylmuramoyl-L-alanine amidase/putative methionine-R-sulfoxide reductase with GAF domain
MSANPNNPDAAWAGQPVEVPAAGMGSDDTRANVHADETANDAGSNALQALLAFACLHEQAAHRRGLKNSAGLLEGTPAQQTPLGAKPSREKEEEFALDEVLQLVAARAVAITGADGVAIALAEENAIVCRAAFGRIAPDKRTRLDPDAGFSGACLRSGQTVRCDDSDSDSRVNAEACRALGARSMIAVPLSAKGRVVGLLEAFSTEALGFNDKDVRSLNLLGELILAAIRPEEEDRLAELAKAIVIPHPELPHSELPQEEPFGDVIATIPLIPARVIVDEKFAPRVAELAAVEAPAEIEKHLGAESAPAIQIAPAVREPAFLEEEKKEGRSVSRIFLLAAVVLIVIGLGGAAVWKARYAEPAISVSTTSGPGVNKTDFSTPSTSGLPAVPEVKAGSLAEVTGIQHTSSDTSSTVVVGLQASVQYEAHTLENPSRIYFDLHDTRMAAGAAAQDIEVNDAWLKRIRMAQPEDGVTRVVLETKQDSQYSVSLGSNPYRLTIEVHKPTALTTPAVKTPPATLPKPSPAVTVTPSPKTTAEEPKVNPAPVAADFQIVLDAGHGGWDLGTVGKKGLLEKDLVLDIVQRLGKLIETRLGAQVIYTRQDGSYLPLEKRAEIANVAKADMFLSVHANYSDLSTARGVETYYTTTYSSIKARTEDDSASLNAVNWTGVNIREKVTDSHRLASDIQQALYGGLTVRNPDIRNRGVKEAQYVVLTGTQMPAVLAEVSFVSSPADESQLGNSAYRQVIAEALFKGVAKYRKEIGSTKVASAQRLVRR